MVIRYLPNLEIDFQNITLVIRYINGHSFMLK